MPNLYRTSLSSGGSGGSIIEKGFLFGIGQKYNSDYSISSGVVTISLSGTFNGGYIFNCEDYSALSIQTNNFLSGALAFFKNGEKVNVEAFSDITTRSFTLPQCDFCIFTGHMVSASSLKFTFS